MAFCKYSLNFSAHNKTEIDNVFINDFLPKAPDLCVKVYIMGLCKCNDADDTNNTISYFKEKLKICEEDVISIFKYWEEQGLVQVLSTDPVEIRYLPINNASAKVKKYNVDDKNIYEDIKRLFGKNDDQPFYMEYSETVKGILERAIEITNEQNKSKVTLNILTIALLQSKESVAYELLKKYQVDFDDIIYQLNESSELETKLDQIQSLVNLNKKVKNGENLIVGRQKELEKKQHSLYH